MVIGKKENVVVNTFWRQEEVQNENKKMFDKSYFDSLHQQQQQQQQQLLHQHRQYQHLPQQKCHHYMYRSSQKSLKQSPQQQLCYNESNNVNTSRKSQKMPSKKPGESCSRAKVNWLSNA